jgi:hypothetical protein
MQPPILPVDLPAVIATFMGMSLLLVPVLGLTARFALKPITEAMLRLRASRSSDEQVALMQQRLELMETQLSMMESEMHRLREAQEFHARLEAPKQQSEES